MLTVKCGNSNTPDYLKFKEKLQPGLRSVLAIAEETVCALEKGQ